MPETIDRFEPRVDVEFESDVLEAARNLADLRKRPLSLSAYKQVCVSIRKAKLLLRTIERSFGGTRYAGADRLLALAEEAVDIARTADARIPESSRAEFNLMKNWQLRHTRELRKLLGQSESASNKNSFSS